MMIGAPMPVVNSGRICASVVSMLSIRSTSVLFNVPEGLLITSPSGILESLSSAFLRITASVWKVARCEQAVESE